MQTKVWDVCNYVDDLSTYPHINDIIQQFHAGHMIAIPTETVYGLAVDATNEEAVKQVFQAKGRPSDNPLIVHIYSKDQLDFVSPIEERVNRLMDAFWPGPISFILPLAPNTIAKTVTAGKETIAVRMPSDSVAREILKLTKLLLAAPSANTSGRPSPTTYEHVAEDLSGKIHGIVASNHSVVGVESTVLDCTSYPFKIARPGAITETMLQEVVPGCITQGVFDNDNPIAPGMKYRHYAPNSPITVIENGFQTEIIVDDSTAVVAPKSEVHLVKGGKFYELCHDKSDIKTAMKRLYYILRAIDQDKTITNIIFSGFIRNDATAAFMNRLDKASGEK